MQTDWTLGHAEPWYLPFVKYWLLSSAMGHVPSEQGSFFGPVQPGPPSAIMAQRLRIAKNDQAATSTRDGNVEAAAIP
jgi:hypothetical protein